MLREKINEAVKTAMKSQDKPRLSTLRLVNAAIQNAEIESERAGKSLAEDDLLGILQKMVKQRQESVEIYDKAGRKELADQERGEIEVIKGFMPQQMSGGRGQGGDRRRHRADRRPGRQGHGQGDGRAQAGLCGQDGLRQGLGPRQVAAGRLTIMSQCLVRGVCSVELVASNFAEASRFYETVWGLRPVPSPDSMRLYRGTGRYHHIVGLHRGPQPALVRIVFDVATRADVDALHRTVAASGVPVTAPGPVSAEFGGGYGFGCKDPDGRNLAFVCDCADHADSARAPDRPQQIAHVNLNARDFDASLKFFTETLGLRVIDENAPLWFLHCHGTDHSSVVLAKTNMPTLNHVAFEMPDSDAVMRGIGRMKDNGYPIEWGPGRHGPGNNVFAYFCGPDELPIEYAADTLQIDDSYVPRGSDYWKFPAGRSDHWGVTQPRSARYYRVQRLFGFTPDGYRLG